MPRAITATSNTALGLESVTYNGFTFPPAIKSDCSAEPIYSQDNRSIKYIMYRIRVETVITPLDAPQNLATSGQSTPTTFTTDYNMNDLRVRLSKIGKPLTFSSIGFGALDVNTGTSRSNPDLNFGPKPRIISWSPIGGNRGANVVWECEVCIAECGRTLSTGNPTPFGQVCEFNYEVNFNVSEYSTRTISGVVEVPVLRTGSGITASVDQYREQLIKIPRLKRFRRSQSFNISPDRRTMHFTITDTEIPSREPYHAGMVEMDIQHSISSSLDNGGFNRWDSEISGSITVAQGYPKSLAWLAFLDVLRSRLKHVNKAKQIGNADGIRVEKNGTNILIGLSITDNLYGDSISFRASYWHLSGLDTILKSSGLWRPVEGSTWDQWDGSMGIVYSPRGYANLVHRASDDALVDLCMSSVPSSGTNNLEPVPESSFKAIANQCPPENESWLRYENFLTETYNSEVVFRQRLPNYATNVSVDGSQPTDQDNTLTQSRGSGSTVIIMRGHGLRVGYRVPIPKLVNIGGLKVVQVNKRIIPNKVVGHLACAVYMAQWEISYRVVSPSPGEFSTQQAGLNHDQVSKTP